MLATSSRARGSALAFLTASVLVVAPAVAAPPPVAAPPAPKPPAAPPPAAPPPAAPPAAKPPAVKPPAPRARPATPPKPPEPALPDPEVHLRVIAPSAFGLWTMRIENDGQHPVRVPADARLLQLTIESGDTTGKPEKPVVCRPPAALRPAGFPDARSLLLAPGDTYTETFDPRLFCFGKDSKAVAGGAIVRARLGWEPPKAAKKLDAPFAVESTDYPPEVAAQKQITAPALVLSYQPPEPDEPPEAKAKDDKVPAEGKDEKADDDKDDKQKKSPPPPVVDENAPRFEISATPFVDVASGNQVSIAVTATNVGHRPGIAAIRARMVAFRVDGPSGPVLCRPAAATGAVPREGYQTVKPGGKTTLTILVEEACGVPVFRRPGLYRIAPSLHLVETGAEHGLIAVVGVARAKDPTLVRVSTGREPYHASSPKSIHITKPSASDGGASAAKSPAPAAP